MAAQGSWGVNTQGTAIGAGVGTGFIIGGAILNAQSFGATDLAQRLAAPRQPIKPPLPANGSCLSGYGTLLIVGLCGFLPGADRDLATGLIVGSVLLLAGVLIFRGNVATKHQGALQRQQADANFAATYRVWREQMHVWERLYYCPKCDTVYDPLTRLAARSTDMLTLLPH